MTKTNVMRLLDAAKIPYRAAEYEVDENDLNGMHAAEGIGCRRSRSSKRSSRRASAAAMPCSASRSAVSWT